MKRLLIIISTMAFLFSDSPVGNWKLSGLRVDYYDIARADVSVLAHDAYGFGIAVPLATIPAGALFNHTINGPFTDATLSTVGVNLNVNLYPDGTGVIGEGSYYPDVDLVPGQCITQGLIFPITDDMYWDSNGGQEGNTFPLTNLIGLPTYNGFAGQTAYGIGVNGSGVFDNWPSEPTYIPTPAVLPAIATSAGVLAVGCAGACGTPAFDTTGDGYPDATLADVQFGGDIYACIGACNAQPAAFGAMLPGAWGGWYRQGDLGNSQMGQDLDVKFLLEWSAIDGFESESGLGDDLTVDEDGDGTPYDRIFGIPYISSTYINSSNPLCDITGGALTGAGDGLTYPVAGDIVDVLGGEAAVGALVTGGCLANVAGGAEEACYGQVLAGIYPGCLDSVQDGVEAQCDAADLDGDGVGTPVEAVTGLCFDASQSDDFAGACAYYGAATALFVTCQQLGFDDETCAAAGEQGVGGVEAYCVYMTGVDCATAGIDQCDVLTDPTFAFGLCGTLAASLTTSETCEEWAGSFDEAFLNDLAASNPPYYSTCSDLAAGLAAGYAAGDETTLATLNALAAGVVGASCPDFAAGLQAGLAAGDPYTIAVIDGLFASLTGGMTCSNLGASYVGMCIEEVAGANDMYVLDLSLETWGMFLTYNAASVQQYLGAGYDLGTIMSYFPELFVNDSAADFDPSCYYTGETCAGRLVMHFNPTCVAEVESHTIVAEFVDLEALDCDGTGDVAGGFDDLPCNPYGPDSEFYTECECDFAAYGECAGTTGDIAGCAGEWLCYDGIHDPEFEGPAGDGIVNVVDVVKLVGHILGNTPLGGYLLCEADTNQDGIVNVVDIVGMVNIILGGRIQGASEATLNYNETEVSIEADGYVGGIEMTVEFADESFEFVLGDHFVADWTVDGNTAHIIMVSGESINNVLEVISGSIVSIRDYTLASADEEIPTTLNGITPLAYEIENAYPNPFNPSTTLEMTLNVQADMSIKVYNIAGQLVDVIADGNFKPSSYSFTWNANQLASGIYFITTQIGNDITNQKVTLIK